jgi:hypothetical protein
MGIPYSREINAAFEQVTPLVAAGFKVLKTTRNISILLAVIQVLTVLLLGLILGVGILLCYSLNPDLEVSIASPLPPPHSSRPNMSGQRNAVKERKQIATPFLRWLAGITVWSIVKGAVSVLVGSGIILGGVWWLVDRMGIEKEGNEDADKALEGMDGDEEGEGKDKDKKGKGKKDKDDGKEDEKEGKK